MKEHVRQSKEDERSYQRRAKEAARAAKRWEKENKLQQASNEAVRFEDYVAQLVALHTDCGDDWEWQEITAIPAPE